MIEITELELTPSQAAKTQEFLASHYDVGAAPASAFLATFARCMLHLKSGASDSAIAEAEVLASAVLSRSDQDTLELDPLIVVSHFAALAHEAGRMPSFSEMVSKISSELDAAPREIKMSGRVKFLQRLLSDLGFGSSPEPSPKKSLALASDPVRLVTASCDEIHEVLHHLDADRTPLAEETVEILSYLALAEMRNYRVDWSATVLRFLIGRGHINDRVIEALRFVSMQRSVNGGYGFIDPLGGAESDPVQRFRSFHLPITLHAIWLLDVLVSSKSLANGAQPNPKPVAA